MSDRRRARLGTLMCFLGVAVGLVLVTCAAVAAVTDNVAGFLVAL